MGAPARRVRPLPAGTASRQLGSGKWQQLFWLARVADPMGIGCQYYAVRGGAHAVGGRRQKQNVVCGCLFRNLLKNDMLWRSGHSFRECSLKDLRLSVQ